MKKKFLYSYIKVALMLFILLIASSCEKLVKVDPPVTSMTSESVYSTNEGAIGIVTGLYASIANESAVTGTLFGLSVQPGVAADELRIVDPNTVNLYQALYTNQLSTITMPISLSAWENMYGYIYRINVIIEGLENAITAEQEPLKSTLNNNVRKQLLGEAKFMRALYYFYLVQLYGDVPLLLTSDYKVNIVSPRNSKEEVYTRLIADLREAQTLLSDNFVGKDVVTGTANNPRVRPSKWAATALLARIYLYHKDYALAEQASNSVIQNTALFSLKTSLDDVFKASLTTNVNQEAILQLQPVQIGWNTQEARVFILPSSGPNTAITSNPSNPVFLSDRLLNAFELGDNRKSSWTKSMITPSGITYFYPFKYKSATANAAVTEYSMVLRLAEQFLICAEARAMQNNLTGTNSAATMLNAIRNRAGLANTTATTQAAMLDAILRERRIELFTEWGHRWFDLKRTGTIDAVMQVVTPLKGGQDWQPTQALYPIPLADIEKNRNLIQNPGY